MPLVGYWPLNEIDGNTAYDRSGNENSGTFEGTPDLGSPGVLGDTSYSFSGSESVKVGDNPILRIQSQVSISVWIKTGVEPKSMSSGYPGLLQKGQKYVLGYVKEDTNDLYMRLRADGNYNQISVVENPDSWAHVVGSYDGSVMYLYINGRLRASNEFNIDMETGSSDLKIGRDWEGRMQEARLYNHALTASEVQYLYEVSNRGRLVSSKKTY